MGRIRFSNFKNKRESLCNIISSWWGVWVFVLAVISVKTAANYPSFVERYYSGCLYPVISGVLRCIFYKLPFSFGDILYALAIVLLVVITVRKRNTFIKKPLSVLNFFTKVGSVLYISFYILWGLNYHREPLHKRLGINSGYEIDALVDLTERLIIKTNNIHKKLTPNDTLSIYIPYTKSVVFKNSKESYVFLSKKLPFINHNYLGVKKSLHSLLLTYMGYSGYINPFTNEAQINSLIPVTYLPVTACHEQAHQLGFAAEDEANFLAYLAAISHHDAYMQYAGYSFALQYCIYNLRKSSPKDFNSLLKKIRPGILKGYHKQSQFWAKYENPTESVVDSVYDAYLKMNNQKNGIKSYNYVVALLVNYYKNNTPL